MGKLERTGEDVPEDAHEPTRGEEAMQMGLERTLAADSTLVADIEAKTAELIDIAEGLKQNSPHFSELAVEHYEIAGMLARKAATS